MKLRIGTIIPAVIFDTWILSKNCENWCSGSGVAKSRLDSIQSYFLQTARSENISYSKSSILCKLAAAFLSEAPV